jgi:antitoxin (DNA-binding transcriptional repressor) of toxin-antitoxin stability system
MARVAHGGERIVIERHGKPMAALVSIADLERIEPAADAEQDDPLLRFAGAWGDIPDDEVDRIVDLIYAERERNVAPPPALPAD